MSKSHFQRIMQCLKGIDKTDLTTAETQIRHILEEIEEESDTPKGQWVHWLYRYGLGEFYDAFVRTAQNAQSTCVHCGLTICLDIVEGGGVPDWKTSDGDYGCEDSPDTCDEFVGSHCPRKM